jgi:hypothetical protein
VNSTEQAHPAWIGVGVVHDTSRSLCGEAIRPFRAMLGRVASPTAIPSDSRLEARIALIFMIPGHILADPGFEGMRTSSYAKEHHTKQMQIAVPNTLSKPDELRAFLGWCLETAPPLVEKALKRQRVSASLKCATQAAARARDHLDEVVEAAETAFAPWRKP